MATLTVHHNFAYSASSGTSFDLANSKTIQCANAYQDVHALSSSASTLIYEANKDGISSAGPAYFEIRNVGAGSCYVALDVTTSGAICFEIPTGAMWWFFSDSIDGASTIASANILLNVYAKGNTTIEVDYFS